MADDGGFKIDNAFLGVTQSLSGRAWRQRPAEAATIRAHMQGLGLEEPLARALASRGVRADQGAPYGIVAQVLATIQAAGIVNVGLVTAPETVQP